MKPLVRTNHCTVSDWRIGLRGWVTHDTWAGSRLGWWSKRAWDWCMYNAVESQDCPYHRASWPVRLFWCVADRPLGEITGWLMRRYPVELVKRVSCPRPQEKDCFGGL